jgi:hypothetical protein
VKRGEDKKIYEKWKKINRGGCEWTEQNCRGGDRNSRRARRLTKAGGTKDRGGNFTDGKGAVIEAERRSEGGNRA